MEETPAPKAEQDVDWKIAGGAVVLTCFAVAVALTAPYAVPADMAVEPPAPVHVIVPILQEIVPSEPPPTRILFVGDMMFDRYIRTMAARHGEDHILSCVGDLLADADIVVGNLEGPITEHPSKSVGTKVDDFGHFTFTFPPSIAALLLRHGITVVNIGNNHVGDFGREGMVSTRRYLDEAGVRHFGGLAGDEPILRTEYGISFISYNQFGGQRPAKVAEHISKEKADGQIVIVYTHWGDEYVDPPAYVRDTARLFAESGADAIIGTHPHVVLPHEYIGGTLVYYSLGNFVFDQYWNEEVSHGLAVLLSVSKDGITAEEFEVTMGRDGRTCPVPGPGISASE